MRYFFLLISAQILSAAIFAQTEILTNNQIVLMTQAGLGKELIIKKIKESAGKYDVSAQNLIELKKAGVDDSVIETMMEKAQTPAVKSDVQYSDSQPPVFGNYSSAPPNAALERIVLSPREALQRAKTVAITKSSLNPSRQALEKALLKRKGWQKYNLNIVRLKEDADLYIEIGRIPFSWLTHRYVFRIYDRQSGTVITAGETTSWGNLSENLAREITQKLDSVL
jgi:hypothetical protein